jgi:hypothetical protein
VRRDWIVVKRIILMEVPQISMETNFRTLAA